MIQPSQTDHIKALNSEQMTVSKGIKFSAQVSLSLSIFLTFQFVSFLPNISSYNVDIKVQNHKKPENVLRRPMNENEKKKKG